jgi:hypothetical protein
MCGILMAVAVLMSLQVLSEGAKGMGFLLSIDGSMTAKLPLHQHFVVGMHGEA